MTCTARLSGGCNPSVDRVALPEWLVGSWLLGVLYRVGNLDNWVRGSLVACIAALSTPPWQRMCGVDTRAVKGGIAATLGLDTSAVGQSMNAHTIASSPTSETRVGVADAEVTFHPVHMKMNRFMVTVVRRT